MPNRIIREGIIASDRINELDWAGETFYRRLLSKVDDHGLFDARASVLRAALYPLKLDRVREADITRWMAACQKARLIVLYEAEGKQYGKVLDTRWQVRSDPKFPLPPKELLQAIANNCAPSRCSLSLNVVEDVDVSVVDCSPLGKELAERLKAGMLKNDPKAKIPEDLSEWAAEAGRIIRLDKREKAEIEKVIDWSQSDDFWKANILSMSKLRKQYSTLKLQMERKGGPSGRKPIVGEAAPTGRHSC